jgi:hypothetical protein
VNDTHKMRYSRSDDTNVACLKPFLPLAQTDIRMTYYNSEMMQDIGGGVGEVRRIEIGPGSMGCEMSLREQLSLSLPVSDFSTSC